MKKGEGKQLSTAFSSGSFTKDEVVSQEPRYRQLQAPQMDSLSQVPAVGMRRGCGGCC